MLSSQQKIQSDLTSHEISLEEMKKHNQGKEAAQRVLSQIDVAQVYFISKTKEHVFVWHYNIIQSILDNLIIGKIGFEDII